MVGCCLTVISCCCGTVWPEVVKRLKKGGFDVEGDERREVVEGGVSWLKVAVFVWKVGLSDEDDERE